MFNTDRRYSFHLVDIFVKRETFIELIMCSQVKLWRTLYRTPGKSNMQTKHLPVEKGFHKSIKHVLVFVKVDTVFLFAESVGKSCLICVSWGVL